MGLLFLIGLGAVLYLMLRGSGSSQSTIAPVDQQLDQRNLEWVQFIAQYRDKVKTKAEKALITRMLSDLSLRGIAVPEDSIDEVIITDPSKLTPQQLTKREQLISMAKAEGWSDPSVNSPIIVSDSAVSVEQPTTNQAQLDNASILLYFGAFLFVASAGLFVAFGGLPGTARLFVMLLVTCGMYGIGVWIHQNRPKLQQAGLAFAGIGLAIAPLCGLAAYNFVFNQANGSFVWFMTSVFCLGLYGHALFTLRKPLINYLFIFTFLSLFESGVSIVDAPVYYFGWMLSLVGIALAWLSSVKNIWPEMRESVTASGMMFMPVSLLVSLVLISGQGAGQFGVSLLLAAAYYGLQAYNAVAEEDRKTYVIATQSAVLGAVGALAFEITTSWQIVAWSLLVAGIVQIVLILRMSRENEIARTVATVAMVSQFVDILLSLQRAPTVLAAAAVFTFLSVVVWLRQARVAAYILAMLSWMTLPLIFGQFVAQPAIGAGLQLLLLIIVLLVQLAVVLVPEGALRVGYWHAQAEQTFIASCVLVLTATFWATPWVALAGVAAVTAVAALLMEYEHDRDWGILAGLFIMVPLLRGTSDGSWFFLTALCVALLVNIAIALRHRAELNRWFSTALWLILPIACADVHLGGVWSPAMYAWSYMIAMGGLLLSRAIARGVVFTSAKAPLTSFARNASVSYVVGYCLAAGVAGFIALGPEVDRLQGTILFGILAGVIWLTATVIEKQPGIFTLMPVVGQLALYSAVRPSVDDLVVLGVYLGLSSVLAATNYAASFEASLKPDTAHGLRYGGLLTAFVAPAAVLFVGQTLWSMPVGLLVAAALVYHYVHTTSQGNRELTGGLALAAIWWLMAYLGVRNIQAYSHTLVALLAAYAYLRHVRGDSQRSDEYLQIMLAVATIPLALQALTGQAGGLYGWWLLLEQIVFMLVGMTIGKRFVTMWGLYVALGAVLYQLRNLGWAALTVLALFIIGFAIYKIQKYNDK